MNTPTRVGDRYRCFILVKEDRGYGGPYGQRRMPPEWKCEDCGHRIKGELAGHTKQRIADHHECGHAPCPRCGQKLLRRKDGTPREHAHTRCPGKTDWHKIEREYVKNIGKRELP